MIITYQLIEDSIISNLSSLNVLVIADPETMTNKKRAEEKIIQI